MITEATFIAEEAGGLLDAPGIHNAQQVAAWKKVTDAVHAKGGIIYCQLWALGRANNGAEAHIKVVGAGNLPFPGGIAPEPMTLEDIQRYLSHYRHAAKCAIEAGFDGVEVHGIYHCYSLLGAHGYLLDQFLQASSNNCRNDHYSGSLENRARFMLEALQVVSEEVGQDRTAIRISPFSVFQGMGLEEDPFVTWGYVCKEIKARFPKLAYVSVTDPRLGPENGGTDATKNISADPFRAVFRNIDPKTVSKFTKDARPVFPDPCPEHPTVFFSAGGYAASDAEVASDMTGDVIAFGRFFIANPDLPFRLKNGLELNPYDRSTFYGGGAAGYIDYPFANEATKKFVPAASEGKTDGTKDINYS